LLHPYRTEPQPVEVKRLDEIFPSVTEGVPAPRVLLKMDTQGYDLRVFEGAVGALEPIVAIQSELSVVPLYAEMPHYTEALATYEARGFELRSMSLVSRTSSGSIQELNCLLTRRGRP